MSPCTSLRVARKKSRSSSGPACRRFLISIRRFRKTRVRAEEAGETPDWARLGSTILGSIIFVQNHETDFARTESKLRGRNLWPQSWVAWAALYVLALDLFVFAVQLLMGRLWPGMSGSLTGW